MEHTRNSLSITKYQVSQCLASNTSPSILFNLTMADLGKSINLKIVYFATSLGEGRSYWTIQVWEHFLRLFQK